MIFKSVLSAVILVIATSHLAATAKEVKPKDFSGWMDEYDSLVYSEELNGFVFFNEAMRGKYHKVLIDSISVYSKDADSDTEVALQASKYLNEGVRRVLTERGLLADEPGPGVLRYKMAITGVKKSKEDLKPHNLLPVSAVFRGAKAVTGKLDTYIDAMFEAELVDSESGQRVAAVVRRGIGETEKHNRDEFEFQDVVPTLDAWLETYGLTLDAFLARE